MHAFSMTNSQPWAKRSNFEALAVNFGVVLKRLCNDYGKILLSKNTLKYMKITRRFLDFQNYLNNSLKTASVWPYRNIWRTLCIKKQYHYLLSTQVLYFVITWILPYTALFDSANRKLFVKLSHPSFLSPDLVGGQMSLF